MYLPFCVYKIRSN